MIIGIIGATSNIAGKAYLPVYAKMQAEHRFILHSRTWEKAEEIRKKYKFEYATTDLSALETCDMVVIHAATAQHFELAKRYLSAGTHVVMDKPISENFEEVQELHRLAEENNVLFVIGFNRRFAPLTDKLKEVNQKNFIKVSKNLANNADEVQFSLYDIFIHPLDTLIYLLDDEIERYSYQLAMTPDKKLSRVMVTLRTQSCMGVASMNLVSGAFSEEFTVEASSGTYRLSELTELEILTGLDKQKIGINGWQTATYNRGFESLVFGMVEAVANFDGHNRVELMKQMKQTNVLDSHEIIHEILDKM